MKRVSYLITAGITVLVLLVGGGWYVERANRVHPAPWPMAQGNSSGSYRTEAVFPEAPSILWRHPLPHGSPFSPVIDKEGTIYVSSAEQVIAVGAGGERKWAWKSASEVTWLALGRHGAIYAMEPQALVALDRQGRLSWRLALANEAGWSPPVVGQAGVIYIGSAENLYAITSDGTIKWTRPWDRVRTWPVEMPNGQVLYVEDDQLTALEPDGSLAWNRRVERSGSVGAISVDGAGHVYYDGHNHLYVMDQEGRIKAQVPAGPIRPYNLAAGEGYVQVGLTRWQADGSLSWEGSLPPNTEPMFTYLDAQGNVLLWGGQPELRANRLFAFDSQGKERWRLNDVNVHSLFAIGRDGRICFTGRRVGEAKSELICIGTAK